MAYEMKEMTGSLFVNQGKKKEKQPDFTGKMKIKGQEYNIAGWQRTGQSGLEFTSLKIEEKEDKVPF